MIVRVCDRCKKRLKDNVDDGEIVIRSKTVMVEDCRTQTAKNEIAKISDVEFCPECTSEFFEWYIKGKKEMKE